METVTVYVLVESKLLRGNEITDRVVGVTTSITEAEAHKARGIEFDCREFPIQTDLFVAGAESTQFLKEMREFKQTAQSIQSLIVNSALESQR